MKTQERIKAMFKSIDNRNVPEFLSFLTKDFYFRFGNAEPIVGNEDLGNMLNEFYQSIRALSNEIIQIWEQDDTVICQGIVTYTRQDHSLLPVPFVNVFKMNGNLIKEYLIYADNSDLFKRKK